MDELIILERSDMVSIADAIRSKTGETKQYTISDIVTNINNIGSNEYVPDGFVIKTNDVNFYDYDGTILYSYSKEEALLLTSMPSLPSQDGLICQGWNWSLESMQSYIQKYGKCEIGATYITDDGKTRIYITLQEGRMSPILGCCPNGTVTIDWGDGTEVDTLTGTSVRTAVWTSAHEYASDGDYIITLTVDGEMGFYGSSTTNEYSGILRYSSSADTRNLYYRNAIKKVEIGSNVTDIGSYSFYHCYGLSSITIPNNVVKMYAYTFNSCYNLLSIVIPNSVTEIGAYSFYQCYGLSKIIIPDGTTKISNNIFNGSGIMNITIPEGVTSIDASVFYCCSRLLNVTIPDSVTKIDNKAFYCCYSLPNITIPDSVTSIGTHAFYGCYSLPNIVIPNCITSITAYMFQKCYNLSSFTIPDNVTSIGTYAFHSCYGLPSITIPDGVTSIGNMAFYQCYGLSKIRFNAITPPTLGVSNVFTGLSTDCIISVPTGCLSAYTSATNYPSSSTYTYIEED